MLRRLLAAAARHDRRHRPDRQRQDHDARHHAVDPQRVDAQDPHHRGSGRIRDPRRQPDPGASPSIGLTFSNALRAFVRQDPDVIMVGEVRDAETANIAIHAALTGHLVLTTLHTETAAAAVPRLLDLGVEGFLLKSTLARRDRAAPGAHPVRPLQGRAAARPPPISPPIRATACSASRPARRCTSRPAASAAAAPAIAAAPACSRCLEMTEDGAQPDRLAHRLRRRSSRPRCAPA